MSERSHRILVKPFGGEFKEDAAQVRWTRLDAALSWAAGLFADVSIEEIQIRADYMKPQYISLRRETGEPNV